MSCKLLNFSILSHFNKMRKLLNKILFILTTKTIGLRVRKIHFYSQILSHCVILIYVITLSVEEIFLDYNCFVSRVYCKLQNSNTQLDEMRSVGNVRLEYKWSKRIECTEMSRQQAKIQWEKKKNVG